MRLSCQPRCAPAIVRPQLVRTQAPTCAHERAQRTRPAPLRIGLPVRRYATEPPATPPPPPPSTPPTPPPAASPPPNRPAPQVVRDLPIEQVPLEVPQQTPVVMWDGTPPQDLDPNRWWSWEPPIPPRSTSRDPFSVIMVDHRRIMMLANCIRREHDSKTKEVLLWRLHKEVIFHDILEKRVLYPMVRAVMHKQDPADTQFARIRRDQKDARWAFRKLKKYPDPKDPLLAASVNAAVHKLKVHFYEEETHLFPVLRRELPSGVLTWMYIQLRVWTFIIRLLGPFAKRSRRPPWNSVNFRLWSLWHWRWGR